MLLEGMLRLHQLMIATYVMGCFAEFLRYDDAKHILICNTCMEGDQVEIFLSQHTNDRGPL